LARVTRPILDRDRPLRSWASEVSPIPTPEGADTVHAGPEDPSQDQDPIFRGVVGGGRVVDEWIRQAQQTARLLGGTGSTFGWADTSGRMFKAASDLMAAWLSLFGAIPVHERVVIDRNRITGGGVTAGIDLALVIAAEMFGERVAQEIQLAIEYDPAPPFESGSPLTAPAEVRNVVLTRSAAALTERRTIVERLVRDGGAAGAA